MEKKRMTRSEAEAIVEELRQALLNHFTERGFLVVGSRNLDGELMTEKRLAKLYKELDDITWGALERGCIIVED